MYITVAMRVKKIAVEFLSLNVLDNCPKTANQKQPGLKLFFKCRPNSSF